MIYIIMVYYTKPKSLSPSLGQRVQDYYAAGNSLLHVILETKKGIPISMALLWALVARRAGNPIT